MYTVAPFIAVAFLATVLFYAGRKSVQRRAACFALYKVRDDLVCLVAEGKLSEDSKVFQHYYQRANSFLSATPRVGFDHILETLIAQRKNHDFFKSIEVARRNVAEIQKLPEMQSEEVRQVIASYYSAAGQVMVAHSSLSRYLFLLLMHDGVLPILDRWSPRLSKAVRLAKFADEESQAIASGRRQLSAA